MIDNIKSIGSILKGWVFIFVFEYWLLEFYCSFAFVCRKEDIHSEASETGGNPKREFSSLSTIYNH